MQKGTRSHPAVGAFCFVMDNWECAPLRSAHHQRNNYFIFRVCRGLRTAPNAIFTGGGVEGSGRCSACFLRKQPRSGQLARPLRHGLRRATLPLLSLRDIFPRSGGRLSSKGEALAKPETLPLCQGLSLWESWQARQGLTERARTLHGRIYLLFFLFHCSRRTHARRER